MEGERKRSKGSFLNFFDWNGKSRKKLFLNNSESLEGPKQEQEDVENITKSQPHVIEVDDRRANLSNKECSDFSCASSITSEEGYGSRAPGVVARLMGLDSLPTSNGAEPSSTPFLNSSSLRASQYDRSTPFLWSECNPMDYLNVSSNQEGYSGNFKEARLHKGQNRVIERFQTEMLPPKSAKSIPVTHHKLLSPIRSSGFIPKKNAAYIMEAAAKIIEASPKAAMNGKVPSIGSSSVPLRIRDLKQKMEAAHTASRPQRSNDSLVSKNTKGQHCDRSPSRSEGVSSGKASTFSEEGSSDGVRNKGKSVSHAVQMRSNVQRREGATSRNSNRQKQKEQKTIRSNQPSKSLPCTEKTKRTSENRTNNVLRQNNQKQNCPSAKETSTSKSSISNQAGRKAQTMNGIAGQSRTVNKVGLKPETSRKMQLVVTDSEKEKTNNISLKKRPVNGEIQIGRNVSDSASSNRDKRSIKCNIAVDGCTNTAKENRKNSMDVVSFTFTSPVKSATPNSQPSVMGKSISTAIDLFGSNDYPYFNKSTSSFPGLNIIGGDALGILLEQKLRELADKVESSQNDMIRDETSASSTSSLPNSNSICNVISSNPAAQDRRSLSVVEKDKSDRLDSFDCFSIEDSRLTDNLKLQGSKEMEECSSSSNFSEAEKDQGQHSSPVSILEPSFESGSCSNTNVDVLNGFSTNESLEVEGERELSDSASSISTVEAGRKYAAKAFSSTAELRESSDWKLDYVRNVLNNAELSLKDFRLDRIPKIMNPHIFHQLESKENGMKRKEDHSSKLERKLMFDCVSECLELMCGQNFVGSYKSWVKTWSLFQRKGWLTDELYKEILGWKSMGDLMVDELVEQDMSTRYGKWLNFNIEAFEEGVELEKGILTSLLDELVSDLFIL